MLSSSFWPVPREDGKGFKLSLDEGGNVFSPERTSPKINDSPATSFGSSSAASLPGSGSKSENQAPTSSLGAPEESPLKKQKHAQVDNVMRALRGLPLEPPLPDTLIDSAPNDGEDETETDKDGAMDKIGEIESEAKIGNDGGQTQKDDDESQTQKEDSVAAYSETLYKITIDLCGEDTPPAPPDSAARTPPCHRPSAPRSPPFPPPTQHAVEEPQDHPLSPETEEMVREALRRRDAEQQLTDAQPDGHF